MDDLIPQTVAGLAVMLDVTDRRCVVVGGGLVGARRARSLAEAGARVVVIGLQVDASVRQAGVEVHERAFEPADLDHTLLVVVATDVAQVNDMVCDAAKRRGVLVNRSDDAMRGDLAFMACHRDGPLTVATHTGGASAGAAARIRDLFVDQLDPAWAGLLAVALEARREIQEKVSDPAQRLALLRRLSDDDAMAVYKSRGKPGLDRLYADMMQGLV